VGVFIGVAELGPGPLWIAFSWVKGKRRPKPKKEIGILESLATIPSSCVVDRLEEGW